MNLLFDIAISIRTNNEIDQVHYLTNPEESLLVNTDVAFDNNDMKTPFRYRA